MSTKTPRIHSRYALKTAAALLLFLTCTLLAEAGTRSQANIRAAHPADDFGLRGAVSIADRYAVLADITYGTANNVSLKLDVYKALATSSHPRQTLIYFHGGGWKDERTKALGTLYFLPFLYMGWNVVNVDYRPSGVSLAPAAVEDCLCALRWVIRKAKNYDFDPTRLVLMGHSAGGHLALTTGMIPLGDTGLGAPCAAEDMDAKENPLPSFKIAAIINWFGITDVADVATGANLRGSAVRWIGNQSNRESVAKAVSPLTYVRAGVPPVVTVHGTKDPRVPYSQSVRLHESLGAAHVPNLLISVPDGKHGFFGTKVIVSAYRQIFNFLNEQGLQVQAHAE